MTGSGQNGGALQAAKEQVKARTDIVRLIQEVTPLKRAGRSYKGLCPFHDEKTPSFHVFPDSQHYKCFGCGEGGDAFSFVMKHESVDFMTALRQLAKDASIDLPRTSARDREMSRKRDDLHGVLSELGAWYVERFAGAEGAGARAYIDERGLSAARGPFALGYAPGPREDAGRLRFACADFFRERKISLDVGVELGVLGKSARGYFDRFRNRVIFPIHDERGRIVGFGGRILPGFESEREPKYLNSPESPVFNKRRLLFGLHQARKRSAKSLLVMEGYTDVIAAQLAGIDGAVATLGTSLTSDHATLLRRFSPDGVTLVFDGDKAGRRAAERAWHALAGEVLTARICLLPDGVDPADLVGSEGAEGMERVLAGSEDALEAWFRLLDARLDLRSHEGRAAATRECQEILGIVTDRARREDLLQRCSARLMITPDALAAGAKPRRAPEAPPSDEPPDYVLEAMAPRKNDACAKARAHLLGALLCEPGLLEDLAESELGLERLFRGDDFEKGFVVSTFERFLEEGSFPNADELLQRWLTRVSGDSAATQRVLAWSELARQLDEPRATVLRDVGFLERQLIRLDVDDRREAYRRAISSGATEEARQLELELADAMRRLHRPG